LPYDCRGMRLKILVSHFGVNFTQNFIAENLHFNFVILRLYCKSKYNNLQEIVKCCCQLHCLTQTVT